MLAGVLPAHTGVAEALFTFQTVVNYGAELGPRSAVAVGDYNNDGFDDLFVTYWGQNVLYRNNGDGTFTDVTRQAGLLHEGTRWGSGCTFIDCSLAKMK